DLIGKELILQPKHLFARCSECNEILKEINREEVHGKVPDYIRETQESFRQCPHCKKIFWEGTHCKRMKEKINRLYGKEI
ncbi:MAG: Mut7-C RNAse domain-containing protein, partial [Nitrospinota bacterium]|nr:Mut7-C RNAse domain-containing protein [Nitrospinota bacterium]